MDFFSQTFTLNTYYHMVKNVFDIIGHDYFKGLKNKFPPIRYLGKDKLNNDLVCLAHPRDFLKYYKIFKSAYIEAIKQTTKINLDDIKSKIYEIYPSTNDLYLMPNGFIGLFLNESGIKFVQNEFNQNDEVFSLNFLKVGLNGIDYSNIKLCGVIETFIKRFNNKEYLRIKYKDLYLVVGEMKDMNILTGYTIPTNKFNLIGGKRSYDETSIESTIRETREELGLKSDSELLKIIQNLIPRTKNIIKCSSFNVFCIYIKLN
jgi:hypothetical protein